MNPIRAIALATLESTQADADAAELSREAKHALSRAYTRLGQVERDLRVEQEKAQRTSEIVGHCVSVGTDVFSMTGSGRDDASEEANNTSSDAAADSAEPEPDGHPIRDAFDVAKTVAPEVQKFHDNVLQRDLEETADAEGSAREQAGRHARDASRDRAAARSATKMIDHLWQLIGSL
ncbi:MAG: hypothetical protein RIT81_41025 [Deltaproteobacteria bacterium]